MLKPRTIACPAAGPWASCACPPGARSRPIQATRRPAPTALTGEEGICCGAAARHPPPVRATKVCLQKTVLPDVDCGGLATVSGAVPRGVEVERPMQS